MSVETRAYPSNMRRQQEQDKICLRSMPTLVLDAVSMCVWHTRRDMCRQTPVFRLKPSTHLGAGLRSDLTQRAPALKPSR